MSAGIVASAVVFWLAAWTLNVWLARLHPDNRAVARLINLFIPALFGVTLIILWEGVTRGFDIPGVLLPAPSVIWARIVASVDILWADFYQTFIKAVLAGYAIGCGSGFIAAIIVDRVPFLRKGLLPIGNLVAALPVVGIAPIMVMWFGFD